MVRLLDGMLTFASALAVYFVYLRSEPDVLPQYALVAFAASQIQIASFGFARLYDIPALRQPMFAFGRMLVAWCGVFAILMSIAFLTKSGEEFSRVWLLTWLVSGFATLLSSRVILGQVVRRWTREGRLERRVVVVGADDRAEKLIDALQSKSDTDIRICGVFDDRAGRGPDHVRGYPNLGSMTALVDFAHRQRVDMLIVTLPITAEKRILEMVKQLYVLPVDIRLAAHANSLFFVRRSYSYVGTVPTFEVMNRPFADWDYVMKWIEYRVLAAVSLVLSIPIFAIVAPVIKLTSTGPVFFKQKRFGFNNELIEVYKFRTLRQEMADLNAERLVTADDPRVTQVGKFLRRTSLDELPQLITVLKGGMFVVGPRPHATAAKANNRLYQDVVDGYFARHRVKPGITGWAQVNGWRGETDTEEKILRRTEHDLYYIENWSIWFDLYIVLRTPFALIGGKNAY